MAAHDNAPLNKLPNGTIHFIGNAHIDPVWLWRWPEGYQETRATFRSALDRLKEFPDFVFTASQAAIYRWIEEADPDMFAEIRQRVEEGRWAIVNGWWMEPDCNIPGGEILRPPEFVWAAIFRAEIWQNMLKRLLRGLVWTQRDVAAAFAAGRLQILRVYAA